MEALGFTGLSKKHRAPKAGVKAKKKILNSKKKLGLPMDRHNPKANSVSNIGRTKRTQQRNLDRQQKKELVPLVDRTEDVPPPVMVVVMGPKGVGKSTLIRSLVKIYSGQNLSDTTGPITVVAGKKRRLTFFECPTDIYSMTDLAKVADLVLLLIDGSYGFEMETFEYLNLLQLHGFPKVMGVLTHLDTFKLNKSLQKTKKMLKQRFWTEIYKGAKMFDFTSIVNGKYPKHETKRLSLHISRVKFRPLVWRNSHPYVVVDRLEDITPTSIIAANPNCDRDVTLYGYIRGTHLKPSSRLHLVGVGDFDIATLTVLEDPCPLPGQTQRASLKTKGALLYAPLSNVGSISMDQDGVYIDIKHVNYTKSEQFTLGGGAPAGVDINEEDEDAQRTPAGLLRSMQDLEYGLDERMRKSELSLFSEDYVSGADAEDDGDEGGGENDDDDQYEESGGGSEEDEVEDGGGSEEDEDGEISDEDEDVGAEDWDEEMNDDDAVAAAPAWKRDLAERAAESYVQRLEEVGRPGNLMLQVYGEQWALDKGTSSGRGDDGVDYEEEEDDLFQSKSAAQALQYAQENAADHHRIVLEEDALAQWTKAISEKGSLAQDASASSEYNLLELKNKFVTGDWGQGQGSAAGAGDEEEEDEVYGDFEDLEAAGMGDAELDGSSGGRDRGSDESESGDEDEGEVEDQLERQNSLIDQQLQRSMNAEKKARSRLEKESEKEEVGN